MNSVQLHAEAENLMAEAERLALIGDAVAASQGYLSAAESEISAMQHVPVERIKTRSVLGESAATLCLRAAQSSLDFQVVSRAIRLVSSIVSNYELLDSASAEIQSTLTELISVKAGIQAGGVMSPDGISVRIRGNAILGAIIPIDRVRLVMDQLESLALRVGEYLSGIPFRTKGPVSSVVKRGIIPMIGPAVSGSYRFNFYVQGQIPFDMDFDKTWVNPVQVVEVSQAVLRAASVYDEESLVSVVHDDQYRTTMLRLVRNALPDGRRISEVSFTRLGRPNDVAVFRGDTTSDNITSMIPAPNTQKVGARHVGILRALDLDDEWILLVEGGEETKWYASPEYMILDDVIGPFVNQRVRVIGGFDKKKKRNIIQDIVSEAEGTEQSFSEA